MADLTRKDVKFIWEAILKGEFETIDEKVAAVPVLRPVDPSSIYKVDTDISQAGVGAGLKKRYSTGTKHRKGICFLRI